MQLLFQLPFQSILKLYGNLIKRTCWTPMSDFYNDYAEKTANIDLIYVWKSSIVSQGKKPWWLLKSPENTYWSPHFTISFALKTIQNGQLSTSYYQTVKFQTCPTADWWYFRLFEANPLAQSVARMSRDEVTGLITGSANIHSVDWW